VEKTQCSSLEIYTCRRSCCITILILPIHIFGEAIQKFITYSYSIQIIHILVHWNPVKNREEIHNFFVILIIVISVSN
jgi:hypothetical protein